MKKSSQKGQLGILNRFPLEIQDICLVLVDIAINFLKSTLRFSLLCGGSRRGRIAKQTHFQKLQNFSDSAKKELARYKQWFSFDSSFRIRLLHTYVVTRS